MTFSVPLGLAIGALLVVVGVVVALLVAWLIVWPDKPKRMATKHPSRVLTEIQVYHDLIDRGEFDQAKAWQEQCTG